MKLVGTIKRFKELTFLLYELVQETGLAHSSIPYHQELEQIV